MRYDQVAVLLPTRGYSKNLVRCLESIKKDEYFELLKIYLVVNEPNSDLTVYSKLLRNDDVVIDARSLTGLGNILRLAVDEIQEEYIFRMDDDDIWHPKRYQRQITFLKEGYDLVIGGAKYRNRYGLPVPRARLSGGRFFDPQCLLLGNYIIHPAVAFSKKIANKYVYQNTFAEDFDLWLRVFLNNIKWTNSKTVLTYTSQKESLTNQKIFQEYLNTTLLNFNSFASINNMPHLNSSNFLKITGQQGVLKSKENSDPMDVIQFLGELAKLEFFQTKRGKKIFNDHLISIMRNNWNLIVPSLLTFGFHFHYIGALGRRIVRRSLLC